MLPEQAAQLSQLSWRCRTPQAPPLSTSLTRQPLPRRQEVARGEEEADSAGGCETKPAIVSTQALVRKNNRFFHFGAFIDLDVLCVPLSSTCRKLWPLFT
jgi:hypothetical protein